MTIRFDTDEDRLHYAIRQIQENQGYGDVVETHILTSEDEPQARYFWTGDCNLARWLIEHGGKLTAFDSAHIGVRIEVPSALEGITP